MELEPEADSNAGSTQGASGLSALITSDQPCRKCGYNLRGLDAGGRCPECGTPIGGPRAKTAQRYRMEEAPRRWLRLMMAGLLMMGVSGVVAILAGVGAVFGSVPELVLLALLLLLPVLWVVGVWVVTRPRPVPVEGVGGPEEWKSLRLGSRYSQLAYVPFAVLVVLSVVAANIGWLSATLNWLAALAGIVIAGGWVPVTYYLSNLSHWASDQRLSDQFRGTGYIMGACTLVFVIFDLFNGLWVLSGLAKILSVAASIVFWLASGYMLWLALRLMSTTNWAIKSAIAVEEREERRIEKAQREFEEERAKRAAIDAMPVVEAPMPTRLSAAEASMGADEFEGDIPLLGGDGGEVEEIALEESAVGAVDDVDDLPLQPLEEMAADDLLGATSGGGDEPYRLELDEDDGPSDGADNGDAPYRLEEDK